MARRPETLQKKTSGRFVACAVLLALLATGACAAPAKGTRVVPMRSYVLGTLGDREIDLRDVCGDVPARAVSVSPSGGAVIIGILTLGFYTPRELRVTCQGSR